MTGLDFEYRGGALEGQCRGVATSVGLVDVRVTSVGIG